MAGEQVDTTRQELFITLEYLMEKCYDSKHTSKTIDLEEYALKKHATKLDRRRVNAILNFLSTATEEYPGILPFNVVKVSRKQRYYIDYNVLEEQEIKKIAEAISRYEDITKTMSDKLVHRFLDRICDRELKEKILVSLEKGKGRVKHKDFRTVEKFISIEDLIESQYDFLFRPKNKVDYDACSNEKVYMELYKLLDSDKKYIKTIGYIRLKGKDVCLYFPDIEGAAIIDINNIAIKKHFINHKSHESETYELVDSKYEDIDTMIDSYYKGQTGIQFLIHFKYVVGTREKINYSTIEKIKEAYLDYFHEPMDYELIEREENEENFEGEQYTRVYVDLHGEVKCNYTSFKNWYWKYELFKHLVVVSPASFNNRLLNPYIDLFKRRVEKYGRKPLTPEEIEERRRKREELKAKKAAKAAQSNSNESNDGGN